MAGAADEDELTTLRERVAALRRTLREAYDRRDRLAEEVVAAENTAGSTVRPELLIALSAAERAILVAEAEMKGAEHSLAMAHGGSRG